jgi:hypothetical protein
MLLVLSALTSSLPVSTAARDLQWKSDCPLGFGVPNYDETIAQKDKFGKTSCILSAYAIVRDGILDSADMTKIVCDKFMRHCSVDFISYKAGCRPGNGCIITMAVVAVVVVAALVIANACRCRNKSQAQPDGKTYTAVM